MPKPQLLKSVARRVTTWKAVLLLALTVVLAFAGLRDRENPVYPGVQIESKKTSLSWPGVICSAGIPVYPRSGGSIGFIIASHCTDPRGLGITYISQSLAGEEITTGPGSRLTAALTTPIVRLTRGSQTPRYG